MSAADRPHMKMMWTVVMVLTTALSVESFFYSSRREHVVHGNQLKISLDNQAEKLEFTPADDPRKVLVYWRTRFRATKGSVSGTSKTNRRWTLDKVTFDDEGTYTERDFWSKAISAVKVAVTPKNNYVKCVAGESLYISLCGINLHDAFLYFSGEAANVTLVQDGARVSQDLSAYWDRVLTHDTSIEITNVNTSDVGHYFLRDRKDRVVSVTRMNLTDHHDSTSAGGPLLALLLLLGIPAGICCCCRKKIFKKKATTASMQANPVMLHPAPSGPQGPCPSYNTPAAQYYPGPNPNMGPSVHVPPENSGPGQWNAPAPGFNPAYPPQNIAYPPAGPQWNGPPPGQYPPAPAAPMGYAPGALMYSAPPPAAAAASEPVKEDLNKTTRASSPTHPLIAPTQAEAGPPPQAPAPPFSTEGLSSSDAAYQFQIDEGKTSSSNFL